MSVTIIGFCISVLCTFGLLGLFRYEEARGIRFAERFRVCADTFILELADALNMRVRCVTRNFTRQAFHYFFHTLLRYTIFCIGLFERGVRKMMHVNRTLAKKAEEESAVRTKLSEVALHKIETALTEEEKRAHKDKSLLGE